ncbi:hypothetical protein [Thermococcus onnurineus]|uniref:hypothetical protein n=1 Tax=Thermococcus onnurineus TaxID=342948 RepID=UPI0003EA1D87|nr:hypothetical protein [Thermococcus onnurineus]
MNPLYKRILDFPYIPVLIKKLIIIGINWTFQGILYMDKTEKMFKILFDLILMAVFWPIISIKFYPAISLVFAFILAHTFNWLFNSNLFGLFKTFGNIRTPKEKFEEYIKKLQQKLENEPSIVWAGVYGSLVRGEFKETSDLDVRLIRKPGFINGVRACIFVMKERTWATFNRFPLDIYVFDNFKSLFKLKEEPIILRDFKGA